MPVAFLQPIPQSRKRRGLCRIPSARWRSNAASESIYWKHCGRAERNLPRRTGVKNQPPWSRASSPPSYDAPPHPITTLAGSVTAPFPPSATPTFPSQRPYQAAITLHPWRNILPTCSRCKMTLRCWTRRRCGLTQTRRRRPNLEDPARNDARRC